MLSNLLQKIKILINIMIFLVMHYRFIKSSYKKNMLKTISIQNSIL